MREEIEALERQLQALRTQEEELSRGIDAQNERIEQAEAGRWQAGTGGYLTPVSDL